jgi:ribosomal protein S19
VGHQFEFRFMGKGPNMSLKNRTNNASEIIAIHHGLRPNGNNKTSSHTHQGVRDHRLLPEFVGLAWLSMQGKGYAPIAVKFKG